MEQSKVRYMTLSDLDEVCEIENASFSIPWSKTTFMTSLADENNILLVYEVDGNIAGYVDAWCVLDEATITNIAVKEDFKRQGIGALLLECALKMVKERGISAVTLEVRKSNETAIRLYNRFGFEAVGIRPGYYEKPVEDAIIMWKYEL